MAELFNPRAACAAAYNTATTRRRPGKLQIARVDIPRSIFRSPIFPPRARAGHPPLRIGRGARVSGAIGKKDKGLCDPRSSLQRLPAIGISDSAGTR